MANRYFPIREIAPKQSFLISIRSPLGTIHWNEGANSIRLWIIIWLKASYQVYNIWVLVHQDTIGLAVLPVCRKLMLLRACFQGEVDFFWENLCCRIYMVGVKGWKLILLWSRPGIPEISTSSDLLWCIQNTQICIYFSSRMLTKSDSWQNFLHYTNYSVFMQKNWSFEGGNRPSSSSGQFLLFLSGEIPSILICTDDCLPRIWDSAFAFQGSQGWKNLILRPASF